MVSLLFYHLKYYIQYILYSQNNYNKYFNHFSIEIHNYIYPNGINGFLSMFSLIEFKSFFQILIQNYPSQNVHQLK